MAHAAALSPRSFTRRPILKDDGVDIEVGSIGIQHGSGTTRCDDCRWVCEAHPERPWDDAKACGCGAPGEPYPVCNVPDDGATPDLPDGFRVDVDDKGWRY